MRIPRYTISLVKESSEVYEHKRLTSSKDSFALLNNLFKSADREQFFVVTLDNKLKPIGINLVSVGTLNLSLVHPREVFKMAILQNSAAVLLAHNHPSGDSQPSAEDITLTKRLVECGTLLGIRIMDHLIIGENRYYSFADEGAL